MAQAVPLTSFVMSTNSAGGPILGPNQLNVSLTLTGNPSVAPTGTVDLFTSAVASCASQTGSTNFGIETIIAGATPPAGSDYFSTASFNVTPPVGTFYVCATYSGDANYSAATTNPGTQFTYYAATTITVLQQSFSNTLGQPVTLALALSTPPGQATPTGTISVYDGTVGSGPLPTPLATVTASATGISPSTVTVTPTGSQYTVIYSGQTNLYSQEFIYGTVFTPPALTAVSPAIIQAGSGATAVTARGYGFVSGPTGSSGSTGSTIQVTDSAGNLNYLPTNFLSSNEVTASIPANVLATAHDANFLVGNTTTQSNPLQLNIYSPQASTVLASTTTPSVPYGSFGIVNPAASVGNPTLPGLPTGSVNFSLTPTGSTTPIALGSTTLSSASGGSLLPGTITTSATLPPTLAIPADLNGDGLTDIVALPSLAPGNDFPPPYLQVYLSTAANSFESEEDIPVGCNPTDFAVGDINGDGIPDLVVVCAQSSNAIATYVLGNGDGTFQPPQILATSSALQYPSNIVIGDFNGDGAMDVALLDVVDSQVQVFTGSKTFGSFTALPASSLPLQSIGLTHPVTADFNQDGKSDIVLTNVDYQGSPVSLLLLTSKGDGTFSTQTIQTPIATYTTSGPVVTDVNGDGYPDVLLTDPGSNGSGQILVYENNGSGVLNPAISYPVANLQDVAGAPFPVIGKPAASAVTQPANIFYSTFDTTTGTVGVTGLNLSGTTFTPVYPTQAAGYDITTYGGQNLVVAGDFNGNGYNDAAVFSNHGSQTELPALSPFYYTNSSAATLTGITQQPPAGTYNLTATYSGATDFAAGASPAVPITIVPALPSKTLASTAASVTYGQSVTYTATIAGVPGGLTPSGTVMFNVTDASGFSYGTATVTLLPVAGTNTATATYTFNTLNNAYPYASPFTVSATYSGDNNYISGTPGSVPLTVTQVPLNISLSSSTSTTAAGTIVTFTVTATSSNGILPTGQSVDFSGIPSGATYATIDANGQAVYRFGLFAPGPYNITASYTSDGVFSAATSNAVTLNVNPAPVQVSVTSNANPVTYPTPVTLTANVSSGGLGIPTGIINFANNGAAIGNGTLSLVNGASGLNQTASFDSSTTANVVGEAIGDFNHDGKQDIAVIESTGTTSTLLVSLGNGDGTFQPAVSYPINAIVTGIVAADLNGDGYSDLAITDQAGDVYIYLASSTGSGAFTLSQTLVDPATAGVTPSNVAIAAADFNKDGSPDLAVLTPSAVLIYLNNGTGNFTNVTPAAFGITGTNQYTNYSGMTVADFNKDGYPDIALSTPGLSDIPGSVTAVTLLTNNGAGTLGFTTSTIPVVGFASGITSGDFNGDGYPDLAVLSGGDSTVDVLLNQKGTFSTYTQYATVGEPVGMTTADFNKDGYDDLVISGLAGGPGGGTMILYGSPSGVFNTSGLLPTAYGYADAAADLNSDGNPDLVVGDTQVTPFIDSAVQTTLSGVVLPAGTNPITGAYTPDTASANVFASGISPAYNQIVNQATPIVTWAAPAPIVYGTPLSIAQLNATASVPGTFTYTPGIGAVLNAGNQTLNLLFTPTSSNYKSVTVSVPITVTQARSIVTWAPPAPIVYGTVLGSGQLNATANAPGTFTYTPAAGTTLTAGLHTLTVVFTPASANYTAATASVPITVNQAAPSLTWATPASIYYGMPLSSTQLDATASVPGVFTYTPTTGTVLAIGQHTLSVTFTPTDAVDYTNATDSVTLTVLPGSILTSVTPASANLGDSATTITLSGAGFLSTSVAQFNGAALQTAYVGPTSLTAVIPASDLTTVQAVPVTVLTPGEPVSSAIQFNVLAPTALATFTGPSTAAPGSQPTLNFQFSQGYPVPVTATFTLSNAPLTSGGVTDPAVQFASGGTTYNVTVPANSTTAIPVQLQTGTLAGTITVTASLSAGGVDITPSTLAPVVINVPPSPPVITSVSLLRSGTTLTVTVQGYSSSRDMQSAAFHFTGASGSLLANPDVTVQLNTAFNAWYSQTISNQYGSAFSYVQTFNLSQDASTIGSVSVTLSNSVGASNTESAQ
jgi:hypothetical protein